MKGTSQEKAAGTKILTGVIITMQKQLLKLVSWERAGVKAISENKFWQPAAEDLSAKTEDVLKGNSKHL